MQKWQNALAHIIKHPKESWNFVTRRDKESFGYLDGLMGFPYENGEWSGGLGGIGSPIDDLELFSYIEAFTIGFVIIGILTLIVMIWFITVVYRLGSQAKPACENDLIKSWKYIGRHLAIALVLSIFFPGLGHIYLVYVLIRAEMTFSKVKKCSGKRDAASPKIPEGTPTVEVPAELSDDVGSSVDYDLTKTDKPIDGKVIAGPRGSLGPMMEGSDSANQTD